MISISCHHFELFNRLFTLLQHVEITLRQRLMIPHRVVVPVSGCFQHIRGLVDDALPQLQPGQFVDLLIHEKLPDYRDFDQLRQRFYDGMGLVVV